MANPQKQLTYVTGYLDNIDPVITFINNKNQERHRTTVTIKTEDGQVLFLETRDSIISKIEKLGIQKGDVVVVGVVFIGVEKKGNRFNNFFLNDINYGSKS